MIYSDLYETLKSEFNKPGLEIKIHSLSLAIRKLHFNSEWSNKNSQLFINEDSTIESNNSFQYYLFENSDSNKSKGIIFLFHGLNEKKWDKYLPWAYQLMKKTEKTVLLFPIAFHMNRAPQSWSDFRLMKGISKSRVQKLKNTNSSFANAALSERLELMPQRFYLSGLQTYNDVYKLISSIKKGEVKEIPADTTLDLFGYSIGAFLSLLLLMDNPSGFFSNSRLFMFCGGTTIDRTFPVSKYILDKLAFDSVSSFFNEIIDYKKDLLKSLTDSLNKILNKESYFQSLISCDNGRELRENRLQNISDKISTIVLKQDEVIPPNEVISSLQNKYNALKSKFEIRDFDYPYNHVIPFPILERYKLQVDYSFKSIFENAAGFLA